MRAYRAVILDLYYTLLHEASTDAHEAVLELVDSLGVSRGAWRAAWQATLDAADRGDFGSIVGRVRAVLSTVGIANPDPALVDRIAGLRLGSSYPVIYPDTRPALAELRKRGYRVGLISNIASYRAHYLAELEFDQALDAVILSFDLRILKPDPRIYLAATEKLGVSPSECVFVDDQPKYLAGAAALGMAPVLINRPNRDRAAREEPAGVLSVETLQELLAWLPDRAGAG